MKSQRVSVLDIIAMKRRGERIPALTAYDYTSAQMIDAAGIPFILIGDTLGMVIQGHETTLQVTLEHIIYHAQMVERGARRALLVGDLPFMTYQVSAEDALRNAARLMREGRVGAVKVEGGVEVADTVRRLVTAGIPVCGHLGFTPQSTHAKGGPRIQGRDAQAAAAMLKDARALEEAGAFAIVLELVPDTVASVISERVSIPTIGIGAGPRCDGEIQVLHDVLGLYTDFLPRHAKRYLTLAHDIVAAMQEFARDVSARRFPGPEQTSDLRGEHAEQFRALVDC